MNGITTQIDKLIKQINQTLVKPIQQPSLHLFDFNYYTFSHKVFNLAFVILEHAEIPKQEKAAYEKLVKKMKQAAKCRPQDESDQQDQQEGKDEITAFLNTRRPFPQTKERGQLYKFLAMREQKEKDTKSFLENINKINLRVVPKQKKIEKNEYAQTYVQTGITWVRKLESIQNSQPCINIQQLKDQLFGKKETRIKINVDQQKDSIKQMRKTFQSKKTISDKGSSKKIEKNKKNEAKKINKSPPEQDEQRINIVSEHGSGNKSKSIIRKHKMGKKQNKSEADELNNTNNRDTSFTSKIYKQNDQMSTNKEKLIDTVQKSTQKNELESQKSESEESEQKKHISQSKLRTQRKSLLKLQKGQQIEKQRQRKSRQINDLEQSKVDEQKSKEVKQIKQGETIEKNQEEEIKQFQTYNKNRSNSNYIDNTFYNDRVLQKNSNLSNLSTHTHTHGLYSDKSTMKERLPYIKDNIKNMEKKEKQRMVERYLRNSGFRNENMTSYYEDSKQKEEKENRVNKENKENKVSKENKENNEKKVKKQNQMSQMGQIQNSQMHRGLQSIKERMKSLLNQKIIQKRQLSQNDNYVMNTLQKLKNHKTTNNSYFDINDIREINETNQSKINPMYNQKINQCIKLMENIHQKACGKPGCKHLQRFFEFVKVFRFQNKKSIKLPTYNIGVVSMLNSK